MGHPHNKEPIKQLTKGQSYFNSKKYKEMVLLGMCVFSFAVKVHLILMHSEIMQWLENLVALMASVGHAWLMAFYMFNKFIKIHKSGRTLFF